MWQIVYCKRFIWVLAAQELLRKFYVAIYEVSAFKFQGMLVVDDVFV
jgi:hypothetical protein